VQLQADGAAHEKRKAATTLGKHTISVTVKFKDQEGKDQVITKPIEYTVGQSAASIALDKMNVLYIGIDNPISISTTSGGSEQQQVSISGGGGSIRSLGGGHYVANVSSQTNDCFISVSVSNKLAGKSQFRVRNIPRAQAYVGGYESGANINAGAFIAQSGVGAGIKDFPFDLQYTVTSFSISCDNDEGDIDVAECQGNTWSAKAVTMIKKDVKPGRTITIDNIRVLNPDRTTKTAPSLVYYIK